VALAIGDYFLGGFSCTFLEGVELLSNYRNEGRRCNKKAPTDHHRKPIWLTAGSHKAEEAEGQSQAKTKES
jgi:hypothetical protein